MEAEGDEEGGGALLKCPAQLRDCPPLCHPLLPCSVDTVELRPRRAQFRQRPLSAVGGHWALWFTHYNSCLLS